MLENLVNALQEIFTSIEQNWKFLGLIVLIVFGIQVVNLLLSYRLNLLGIYPRKIRGLIGIFIAPALHGSFQHLFFNTIPFIVLGSLVLVSGKSIFLEVSCLIILVSGLLIWLFGRPAFHVGASALIVGYWGFLLSNAYQQRSIMSVLLAFLCLYYFGGIILSFFPSEEKTSWEGHIYGFISGLIASYAYIHQWIT